MIIRLQIGNRWRVWRRS